MRGRAARWVMALGIAAAVLMPGAPVTAAATTSSPPVDPAGACWSPWGRITLLEDSSWVMRPAGHAIKVAWGDFGFQRPAIAYPVISSGGAGPGLFSTLGVVCYGHFYVTMADWQAALANFGDQPLMIARAHRLRISLAGHTLLLTEDQDHFEVGTTDAAVADGVAHAQTTDLGYPAVVVGHHLDSGTSGRTYAIPVNVMVLLDPRFYVGLLPSPEGFTVCLNSTTSAASPISCLADPAIPPVLVGDGA